MPLQGRQIHLFGNVQNRNNMHSFKGIAEYMFVFFKHKVYKHIGAIFQNS